ncbi:MAG: gliding motility-associated C-terminal domain-containing protein, partial [Bacteroidota bacterium]
TTYYVTVTGSNGCTATASSLVTVNALPSAAISGTLNICEGNSTTLTATGGNSYSWSSGQTTDAITVSPASNTTYIVTVTNTTTGCSSTATATVNVTPVPTITVTGDTVLCVGESTTLTANGGDSYAWSTGDNTASTSITPGSTTIYTVTVTITASGCTNTINQTVHVNTIPVVTFTGDTMICIGESTTVTASGASSYLWEGGTATADLTINPSATTYYSVTATNGTTSCSSVDSVLISVNDVPVIVISGVDTICSGETTILTASGGDVYSWSSGDNTPNTSVTPSSTITYDVTVTDTTTGCSDIGNIDVFVYQLPDIQFAGDTSLCIGDSTIITAIGGDDYLWSNGSVFDTISISPVSDTDYYITVTDNNTTCINYDTVSVYVHDYPVAVAGTDATVCEGIPVQLSSSGGVSYSWGPSAGLNDANIADPIATPTSTTTYVVTVTNIYSCSDTASVTVTINPAPDVNLDAANLTCYQSSDGSAWVASVTGISPFIYVWSSGGSDTIVYNQPAGNYYITVTDAIGCSSVEMITITQPDQLESNESVSNISCFGYGDGSITLNPTGGTSPYTYNWSSGGTSNVINGLSTGSYSVTITDDNGCSRVVSNIVILQPDSMLVDVTKTDCSCYGYPNGSSSIDVDGGTPPYTYSWSNGSVQHTISNVSSGLYYYTVTDGNNCKFTSFITIQQPTDIIISDSIITMPSCAQADDGAICPQIFGGIPPYSYLWSNNSVSQCIAELPSGTYEFTVTDFNSCIDTAEYVLSGGTESCLIIPTFFSPNGDGINDKWEIRGIQFFPEIEIEIFSRWGDVIFEYSGSGNGYMSDQWDGTHNGKELPISSFVYILTLNDGNDPIQGIVTIKK